MPSDVLIMALFLIALPFLLLLGIHLLIRWGEVYQIKKIQKEYKKQAILAEEQELQELIYDIKANDYEIIYVFKELQ
jgi:hypothetical protein